MPLHGIPVCLSRPAGMSLRYVPPAEGTPITANELDTFPYIDNRARRAWRKSCDRCHSQKLKCSSSTQASPFGRCSRCTKAGLPCTFSTRSARQPNNQNQNQASESDFASDSRGQLSRTSVYEPQAVEQISSEFDWASYEDADRQKLGHGNEVEHFNEQITSPAAHSTSTHTSCASDSEMGYFDWDLTNNQFDHSNILPTAGSTDGSHRASFSSLGDHINFGYAGNGASGTSWGPESPSNSRKRNPPQNSHRADQSLGGGSSQYSRHAGDLLDKQSSEFSWMDHTSSLQQQLEKLESGGSSRVPRCLEDLYTYPIGESLQRGQQFLSFLKNKNQTRRASTVSSSTSTQPNTFNANIFSETLDNDFFQSALSSPAAIATSSNSRRTTSIILPLTSYVLLVQIIAHQAQHLCSFLHFLELQPSPLVAGSILNLRDMHSPLSQPLSCIFRAIMSGIEILKGVETELEIPVWLSVDCTDEDQMRDLGEENLASRIVSALWESEAMRLKRDGSSAGAGYGDGEDGSGTETALVVLRRCVIKVRSSMKRHIGL